jgi:SSS family solute:Na+ symporter
MDLHWLDWGVLAVYFLATLCLALYLGKKNTSTEEYFVGGRRFSGWVIGLSLVGTSISSITFLAYPADAFKTAWLRYLPNLALPLAILLAAYLFLPFFRRQNATTAYEFLEQRFGPSVRLYGAVAFIIAQLFRISTILYLLALLLNQLTGIDVVHCVVIAGLFVAVYTIVGGIDAVIWTDVIQTLVLLLGGIACLVVIVQALPNGLSDILSIAESANKLSFSESFNGELRPIDWGISLESKTGSMLLLVGLTGWLTEYSSNQNTVQRYCASRSLQEARKGMFVCALSSLPIWAFYMFLGTALFAYYQLFPTIEAQAMLEGSLKAEGILPYFIANELPVGLVGLVVAAALAAAMSSLDSSINAISTVGIIDIYKRFIRREEDDRHYLKVAWFMAGLASLVMLFGAVAILKAETKTLQDFATILVSLLGGGLLGLYLIGFFTKTADSRAVWVGICCTLLFTAWSVLSKNQWLPASFQLPFDLYYAGLVGNVVMFVVVLACGYMFRASRSRA